MIDRPPIPDQPPDPPEKFPEPLLISVGDLATIIKCSTRTVWRMESAGLLPKPLRVGGTVRWRYREILRWIEDGGPRHNTPNKPR